MYKNYDLHTDGMLKEHFPYMFDKANIGFTFYRGWMPILAGVCIEIDQLLGDQRELFHWTQIKEKFGSGRFYYSLGGATDIRVDLRTAEGLLTFNMQGTRAEDLSDLQNAISALVRAAEAETAHSCLICGQSAQPRSYGGYYLNLCTAHHPDKIRRPGDTRFEAVFELAKPRAPEGGGP